MSCDIVFAAAAGDGRSNFYVIGGRRYDHERSEWEYQTIARVYNKNDNIWRTITPLPKPMGKFCCFIIYLSGNKGVKVFCQNRNKRPNP